MIFPPSGKEAIIFLLRPSLQHNWAYRLRMLGDVVRVTQNRLFVGFLKRAVSYVSSQTC